MSALLLYLAARNRVRLGCRVAGSVRLQHRLKLFPTPRRTSHTICPEQLLPQDLLAFARAAVVTPGAMDGVEQADAVLFAQFPSELDLSGPVRSRGRRPRRHLSRRLRPSATTSASSSGPARPGMEWRGINVVYRAEPGAPEAAQRRSRHVLLAPSYWVLVLPTIFGPLLLESAVMIAMPTGPRTVSKYRRVTIPGSLADQIGIKQYSFVSITSCSDRSLIEIRPTRAPRRTYGRQDPRRPRWVPQSRQVTLPATVLNATGLDIGSVVAFRAADGCVQVFDASRVVDPMSPTAPGGAR